MIILNNNTNVSLDEYIDSAMSAMENSLDKQEDSYLGPFWYDVNTNSLFGQVLTLANDAKFYKSSLSNIEVRTGNALHKSIWDKEQRRIPKNAKFIGDYKWKPRGRVFQDATGKFIVYTGKWINDYPMAKNEIIFEFQLPENNTEFRTSEHWDLGHGWSQDV